MSMNKSSTPDIVTPHIPQIDLTKKNVQISNEVIMTESMIQTPFAIVPPEFEHSFEIDDEIDDNTTLVGSPSFNKASERRESPIETLHIPSLPEPQQSSRAYCELVIENNTLMIQHEEHQEMLLSLNRNISNLLAKLSEKDEIIREKNIKIEDYEETLNNLNKEMLLSSNTESTLSQKVTILENEVSQKTAEILNLKGENSNIYENNQELLKTVQTFKTLDSEKHDLTVQISSQLDTIAKLRDEIEDLKVQNQKLNEKIEEEQKNEDLIQEIDKLRKENETLLKENNLLILSHKEPHEKALNYVKELNLHQKKE